MIRSTGAMIYDLFRTKHLLSNIIRNLLRCLLLMRVYSTGNTADIISGVHGAWVHLKGGSVWDFAAGALAVQEVKVTKEGHQA